MHLLTDAIAIHAALPPVALVTVKLVLRGPGYQADAKAVNGQAKREAVGGSALTQLSLKGPSNHTSQ